jgi:hypothetical protein
MGPCCTGVGFLPQQLFEQSELRPNQLHVVEQPGKAPPMTTTPQTQRCIRARMAVTPS